MVPRKIGKHIGQIVQARRKELKLTQEDLERTSGIPQGTISRIEQGGAEDIRLSTFIGLAEALGLDPASLLKTEQAAISTSK
jgi:transcriptional regulator with XRE-family HTH domain